MLQWIVDNKEWVFSGFGGVIFLGLIKYWYERWKGGNEGKKADNSFTQDRARRKNAIEYLPSTVLRILLSPSKVIPQIRIGLREESPIDLKFTADVPHVDLYFQIMNFSPLNLVLDRMLIDISFGQPTFNSAILEHYVLPPGEITKNIFLCHELLPSQIDQIKKFQTGQGGGTVHLRLTAYFESRVGRLKVFML